MGTRVGSAATNIVDGDVIMVYFELMSLGGSITVAFQQAGDYFGIEAFDASPLSCSLRSGSAAP